MPLSKEEEQELADLEELEALEAEERAFQQAQPAAGRNQVGVSTLPAAAPKPKDNGMGPIEMETVPFARGGTVTRPKYPAQTMLEGAGQGITRLARGGGNLLVKGINASKGLPSQADMPEWLSDESLSEQDRIDKPLLETGEGALGSMGGQTAASLPLSVGSRAAIEAPAVSSLLTRTLASPLPRVSLEGSISSAAAADPENQKEAALIGAGLGPAMSAGGRVLKRVFGKGLAKTGEYAENLEQFAEQHGKDLFIPIAQAVEDKADITSRLVKSLYKEAVGSIPGAGGQIKSQGDKLLQDVRGMALKEADFKNVLTDEDVLHPEQAVTKLKKAFDDEYKDTVKSYAFTVPKTYHQDLTAQIRKAIPNIDDVSANRVATMLDEHMARFSSGKPVIDGDNLMNVRDAMRGSASRLQGPEAEAAKVAIKSIDDIIEAELKAGNKKQNLKDLARYKALAGPEADFEAVANATKKAVENEGEFSPGQLARSAQNSPLQKMLGQVSKKVTNKSLSSPSLAGRAATVGAVGAIGGLPGAAAALVGGNIMATKTMQRLLMGKTGAQQALVEALRKNPKKAQYVGAAARGAATTQAGDEDE